MSIIRPFGGTFTLFILAGVGAIICTGALAQQFMDTGSSQVTVDLGVIEDSGYGAGNLIPAAGGRRLLLPGPNTPVSRLLVPPPEGSAPQPMKKPPRAKATQPQSPGPAPVAMKTAAAPPKPPMPAPAAAESPAVQIEVNKKTPKPLAMEEKKPAAPEAEPPIKPAPAAAPLPPEMKTVKLAPAPEISKPSPPPVQTLTPGLAMQVVFSEKASKLPTEAKDELKGIAAKLQGRDKFRLQLLAYAGGESLSSSKARRLSLSRALSVRSFLIESGIHSTRIDVRALGNKTAEGPINRVDVNVAKR